MILVVRNPRPYVPCHSTISPALLCCLVPLQMWVGRWAQIGFVSSIIGEFASGHGTLQQVIRGRFDKAGNKRERAFVNLKVIMKSERFWYPAGWPACSVDPRPHRALCILWRSHPRWHSSHHPTCFQQADEQIVSSQLLR